MAEETVIDTMVLQKANAPIIRTPKENRLFKKRLAILLSIAKGDITILISSQLLEEYKRQISSPRNEYIKAFFEMLLTDKVKWNWSAWRAAHRVKARSCRYPQEDDHLLRTAIIKNKKCFIISEEDRIIRVSDCINRKFRVRIKNI